MKKYLIKISGIVTIFALILLAFSIQAGELENEKDVMSRLKASTSSNHSIEFQTPTGVDASTDTITITFPAGFDLATNSVAFGDMDLEIDATCDGTYETSKTLAATHDDGIWGASVSSQTITFTAPTDATSGEIAADSCVRIEIGTNAESGSNQIINPSAGNDYKISFAGEFGDSGALAVSILSDDRVSVTATVDPTFTFTISKTSIDLGTLSTSSVSSDSYTITTKSNAEDGYATTIVEDGNLRDGSNDIDDTSGDVDAGYEEYGIRTSGTDGQYNSTDTAITGTPKVIAQDTSGPIDSQQVTVTHKASIDDGTNGTITAPGSYSHTVTLVSTGTF